MTEPQGSGRSAPTHFASVDSTPKTYAKALPPWKAPALLGLFTFLATVQILLLHYTSLAEVFPQGDFVLRGLYEGHHAIAFRVFSLSFLMAFAVIWGESSERRWELLLFSAGSYALACMLLDFMLSLLTLLGLSFSLHFCELLSGLLGFALFSMTILENGSMPPEIVIRQRGRTLYARQMIFLLALAAVAAAVSLWVANADFIVVEMLRSVALLGGIGPGVFLLLPFFFMALFLLAHLRRLGLKRGQFAPDVTIIIPAHNEEYIIARTIAAIDVSAQGYGGGVHVIVVDNNSKDPTFELAQQALAACRNVTGVVLKEGRAGKSFALNSALAAAKTEFLIRVDADTQIQPNAISYAMSWFYDERVGVVGGLPIVPYNGPFDGARQVETLVKHGFYSIALEAIGGVIGVPGMFAVYRTKQLRALGGFVSGMNGEDTDISLRIAERGYRMVIDARVMYISEVPATVGHMREQRLRWFRSVFHISSRSRQIILGERGSLRGKLMLPFMLVNSARRAMMVPLVIFGGIEYLIGTGPEGFLRWQGILAVMLGSSILISIFACFVNGRISALKGMPDYILFRVMRSYFTLESMLTILVLPKRARFRLRLEEALREGRK